MFDLFKRYVDEKYMRFDNNEIRFGKERLIFYFVQYSVIELYLNRGTEGWKYLAAKFIISRKEGNTVLQQHGVSGTNGLVPSINVMLKVMDILGIGSFKIAKADREKAFAVLSGSSALALEAKASGSTEPIDFVAGGMFAGAVQYYTKRPSYAVELSCAAQSGVDECVWAVGGKNEIMEYVDETSPDNAELAKKTLGHFELVEAEMNGNSRLKDMI